MGTLLAGKTVIITGAGRGTGLATALHLHDEDAQVVATVRSPEHLTQLKVDDDRLIGRVVDVNVKGVFLGSKYAIPELLKAGGGSIVNFGSINSIGAEKLLTTYTASKGAVLTLTKAIALDFGAQGIRANTVCPGFVDTPLNVPHYEALGGREATGLSAHRPRHRTDRDCPLRGVPPIGSLHRDHRDRLRR